MTTDVLARLVVQSPASGPPVAGFFWPGTFHGLESMVSKRDGLSCFGGTKTAAMHPQTDMVRQMATILKNAQQGSAMAAIKEERARDAALAMREYEAERLAVHAKTVRLRALRLAKEAETRQHTKTTNRRRRIANLLGA